MGVFRRVSALGAELRDEDLPDLFDRVLTEADVADGIRHAWQFNLVGDLDGNRGSCSGKKASPPLGILRDTAS